MAWKRETAKEWHKNDPPLHVKRRKVRIVIQRRSELKLNFSKHYQESYRFLDTDGLGLKNLICFHCDKFIGCAHH